MNCYEVMQHVKGERYSDDKCITSDTCFTKDEVIKICNELNNSKFRSQYKYYWRMRK